MIEIKNGTLFFDGCDTTELAATYGTPLYVYSESVMQEHFDEIRRDFLDRWPGSRAAYAAKAFCTVGMCKLVERAGLCIDVVSGGELYTALAAGFPPERIEFNGNNKLPRELELAVEHGVGRIIVDAPHELETIEALCAARGRRMKVLYRVTPGVKADSHDYIVTGKKDSKFGFPLDEEIIYPAVARALEAPHIDFLGFHFHVGSQLFDVEPYVQATEAVLELVRQVKQRFGAPVRELNLGGGFGIRYTTEQRRPYRDYLDPMLERIAACYDELGMPRPAVVIEPGRSIVGDAGLTLYTVGSIKEIPGVRKYVSVDGGMTDNIRPALYQAVYRGMLANRAGEEAEETVTVCGKCCESGDILLRDAELPRARTGDVLAVFSTGAYGYSMASNYNCNPIPAVVLARAGQHRLMVRRQSYEDLIRNQIPEGEETPETGEYHANAD